MVDGAGAGTREDTVDAPPGRSLAVDLQADDPGQGMTTVLSWRA